MRKCAPRSAAVRYQERSVLRRGGAARLRSSERECAEKDADGNPKNGDLGSKLAACQECHGNRCCEVPRGKLHAQALQEFTFESNG